MFTPFHNRQVQIKWLTDLSPADLEDLKERSFSEFNEIKSFCQASPHYLSTVFSPSVAAPPDRNMFDNILPYPASSQVFVRTLKSPEPLFMNANRVSGSGNFFICTQYPMERTRDSFWSLVLQEKARLVVMLAQQDEAEGLPRYFPAAPKETLELSKTVSVVCSAVLKADEQSEVRKLVVRDSGSGREELVVHLAFKCWADFEAPARMDHLNAFLVNYYVLFNQLYPKSGGSVAVHCRAGVGRTGTFVAIDRLLRQAMIETTNFVNGGCLDVMNTVVDLRYKRNKMVSNKEQYWFLYRFLHYCLKNKASCMVEIDCAKGL